MSTEEVFVSLFVCSAAVLIAKLVVDAVVRLRERATVSDASALDRRLERMEHAIEAMAIEIERTGEAQRFNARLAQSPPSAEALPLARQVTPH